MGKVVEQGVEKVVANVGAAAAAGSAASTVLKSNLPVVPKLIIAGTSAFVVGASTKIGISLGEALVYKNGANPATDLLTKINPDRIPSPTEFFVPSILETHDLLSPLEELIKYQFMLNFLILFSVLILIALLFNKLFLSNNIFVSFISRYLNKNIIMKFDSYRMKIERFNNNYFFLLFLINSLTLLFNLFLSLVISCELTFDLDYYLAAHNGIKYSLCFLIMRYGSLGNSGVQPQQTNKTTNNKNNKNKKMIPISNNIINDKSKSKSITIYKPFYLKIYNNNNNKNGVEHSD